MTHTAELIAEARAAGVRLAFDADRLCAYAVTRPPAGLVERLRAARPQLVAVLRAEAQLLQTARHLDIVTAGRTPDPTTASTFVGACRELYEAFLEGDEEHIRVAVSAWPKALPAAPVWPRLGTERPPAGVLGEFERARHRLARVASENPGHRRPTWDEYESINRALRSDFESGDLQRGLAAVTKWEQGVLELLKTVAASPGLAGPKSG